MTSKLKTDVLETVSGSGTIALTNQLSGMTGASMPSGSVLQVTTSIYDTVGSTTSASYVATGWSFSITPTSSSSDILINVTAIGSADKGTNCLFRLYRSIGGSGYTHVSGATGTHASVTDYNGFLATGYIPSDTHHELTMHNLHGVYKDSPNTTAVVTYKLYYRARSGANAYINRSQINSVGNDSAVTYGVCSSSLTEIKG